MKNQNEQAPAAQPVTELTPELTKKITDYINLRKAEKADPKVIRKEVFKMFGVDTTKVELKWDELVPVETVKGSTVNERVAEGKQLTPTHNIARRSEPVNFAYKFTPQEIATRGNMLAQLEIDRDDLEDSRKNVNSDYQGKIKEKETQISKLAREINSGFEMRNETCEVVRNFDTRKKQIYNRGKLVKEEEMTTADYTLPFPSDDVEETAAEVAQDTNQEAGEAGPF